MGPPFDAVLSDVDGVVRHWDDTMGALERGYGIPSGTLSNAAFAPARLLPAITGRISDADWRAGVAVALAESCGSLERAERLVADWSSLRGRVDTEVIELFTAMRPAVPIILVSNGTTRLESDLEALGISAAVDAVVNSARVGVAKPDPAIYRFAARRAGVATERCVFIDDRPDYAETARQLGMVGLEFTGAATLRAVLSDLAPELTE